MNRLLVSGFLILFIFLLACKSEQQEKMDRAAEQLDEAADKMAEAAENNG